MSFMDQRALTPGLPQATELCFLLDVSNSKNSVYRWGASCASAWWQAWPGEIPREQSNFSPISVGNSCTLGVP